MIPPQLARSPHTHKHTTRVTPDWQLYSRVCVWWSKPAVLLALTRVCCRSVWELGSGPPVGTWCAGCPDCCRWSDPPPPQSDWLSCSGWRPSWCLWVIMGDSARKRVEMTLKCLWNYYHNLTLATGGEHEVVWVILAHPVNHIDLLQCLSDGVFVLSVTGNVGRPELTQKQTIMN